MQERINDSGGLATLETAQPLGWRAAAIGEYERSWPDRQACLRTDLSSRILALTGRQAFPEEIYSDGHLAVAGVDGATLRPEYAKDLGEGNGRVRQGVSGMVISEGLGRAVSSGRAYGGERLADR